MIHLLSRQGLSKRNFPQNQKSKIQKKQKQDCFLPFPMEFVKKINWILQEEEAGNISKKIHEKFVAIEDELVEYKLLSTKQHRFSLFKCSNWMRLRGWSKNPELCL